MEQGAGPQRLQVLAGVAKAGRGLHRASSVRHARQPAPVQPGPTPAASPAARAEQRPRARPEPSRRGRHAHGKFGQRASRKTRCRSPRSRRLLSAASQLCQLPFGSMVLLGGLLIEPCPPVRRPGSCPAVVRRGANILCHKIMRLRNCRSDRGLYDSPLEGTGFEPSVPPRKRRPWERPRGRPSSSRETTCA